MNSLERIDNIYVIDTKMYGHDSYMSAYLVKGKEIALIDTGHPRQIESVRAAIKAHGFSISDISYIFVTHCEHLDHGGNVAPILMESPKASVYINPIGLEYLTNPAIETALRKKTLPAQRFEGGGEREPAPDSRIKLLNDGDVFDLGNGEKLRVIFAPGHQPSGIVILEEKNMGLFINDLVGNYFPDVDAHYPLTPEGSDHMQAIESLKKLIDLPLAYLYLGHYGICEKPKEVMTRAIHNMQKLIDIGIKCMREGKPENIASQMYEMILPELEKLRLVRGEKLYQYATQQHINLQLLTFTKYCQERFR